MPQPKPSRHTQLLSKAEVLKRVGVSYPTIWKWMQQGKFPRSRLLGEPSKTAKVAWYEHEVEAWLAGLPLQTLKGDEAAL
jgi:prophage regulatory protein